MSKEKEMKDQIKVKNENKLSETKMSKIEQETEIFFKKMFEKIKVDNSDISEMLMDEILTLKESKEIDQVDLAISIIEKCMERTFVDEMSCDQLFNLGKLLLLFEKNDLITLEKLMKFCYEIFREPINISYAIVDFVLYGVKEKLYEQPKICVLFQNCVYFNELTPLLTVYIEFGSVAEKPTFEISAFDPLPKLHQTTDCVKLMAEKSKSYCPSLGEIEEFSKVDIGRIIVHVNDCNMKNHYQFSEAIKIEPLTADIKSNIRFVLNSSSTSNLQQKAQELSNSIQPRFYPALVQHFVELIVGNSIFFCLFSFILF